MQVVSVEEEDNFNNVARGFIARKDALERTGLVVTDFTFVEKEVQAVLPAELRGAQFVFSFDFAFGDPPNEAKEFLLRHSGAWRVGTTCPQFYQDKKHWKHLGKVPNVSSYAGTGTFTFYIFSRVRHQKNQKKKQPVPCEPASPAAASPAAAATSPPRAATAAAAAAANNKLMMMIKLEPAIPPQSRRNWLRGERRRVDRELEAALQNFARDPSVNLSKHLLELTSR
jgi:hypothetical protein